MRTVQGNECAYSSNYSRLYNFYATEVACNHANDHLAEFFLSTFSFVECEPGRINRVCMAELAAIEKYSLTSNCSTYKGDLERVSHSQWINYF